MHRSILLLLLVVPLRLFSQTYTVQTVPNMKLVNGSYVSNPDQIISAAAVADIDNLLMGLEKNSTTQVAVVVLRSIGDNDIFDFAQELFNTWGIGQSQNDNGLLILLVYDQRTVRFHTGDGLEGVLPDAICKRIQREKMVPHFKENRYDEAMVEGVREVHRILSDPAYAAEIKADITGTNAGEEIPIDGLVFFMALLWIIVVVIIFIIKKVKKRFRNPDETQSVPTYRLSAFTWLVRFLFIPLVIMIVAVVLNHAAVLFGGFYLYIGSMIAARKLTMDREAGYWLQKKEYQALYNFYQDKKTLFNVTRFLFPFPVAFMYPFYKRKMQMFRDHPRDCTQCGATLQKLDEKADDAFLSAGQRKEEELKSVDYDVWTCAQCKNAAQFIYITPGSKYKACPKCKFHAFHTASRRTIQSATEYREGTGEEVKTCKFCNHRDVSTYTIPKIQRSSSSSGSGGSSSGGSWGGGRSSGGGASSSW